MQTRNMNEKKYSWIKSPEKPCNFLGRIEKNNNLAMIEESQDADKKMGMNCVSLSSTGWLFPLFSICIWIGIKEARHSSLYVPWWYEDKQSFAIMQIQVPVAAVSWKKMAARKTRTKSKVGKWMFFYRYMKRLWIKRAHRYRHKKANRSSQLSE